MSAATVTLTEEAAGLVHEFIAFDDSTPSSSGALHFAPRRWLLLEQSAALEECSAAEREGRGALMEVTGKYRRLVLTGPGARRALAFCFDPSEVLRDRSCAAVTLFDAPVILARTPAGFTLLTHSSYAEHLSRTLRSFTHL